MNKVVTSESVAEGHPDKLADFISDSVLDAVLAVDPEARVAAETLLSGGLAIVAGEISFRGSVDIRHVVREAIREIGYTDARYGIDADHSAVLIALNQQSPDIARGVDRAQEAGSGDAFDLIGAGDQGLMFGYATDETPELMPLPITLAHKLTARLARVRKDGTLAYLRPDGKAQVTVVYDGDAPLGVGAVVLSAQHDPDIGQEQLHEDLRRHVVQAVIPPELLLDDTRYLINPTGRFVIGGPEGDAGLTGRKIIVDTYGGAAPHGGGAFSGKDPTKVDRSASYYARYIAKNVVAAGLARRCLVQLAYAIGVAHPVGMYIESFGTSGLSDELFGDLVAHHFDARPGSIIEQLDLRRPIYRATSVNGHFGRDGFPWERLDRVETLQQALSRV